MNYQNADMGGCPFVSNLCEETLNNPNFRTARWTGNFLQLTLMRILPDSDIGLEIHENLEQLLYVESGTGMVLMGKNKNTPDIRTKICPGSGIIIPEGTWHNIVNTSSRCDLRLFSVYAPVQHPKGTVEKYKPLY